MFLALQRSDRQADVAELVYAHGSEPCPARVGGSSPLVCTFDVSSGRGGKSRF